MFKRQGFKKLGKKASHRNAMSKNLLRSIFQSGYVTTTTPKAKMLKGEVESLISRVKKADKGLNLYKYLETVMGNRKLSEAVINYVEGNGIVKLVKVGYRAGDNAQKSKVELVGFKVEKKEAKSAKTEAKKVVAEPKKVERRGLKNVLGGNKSVSKNVAVKKERSRTRSGI
ncbi:MAG TPA: L17 family ribosomal protein [Candidatus Dojkabacteria bacterium]|nr:L17 family ribosomal protein [Candidatus Dojkabacteria bacterium]